MQVRGQRVNSSKEMFIQRLLVWASEGEVSQESLRVRNFRKIM